MNARLSMTLLLSFLAGCLLIPERREEGEGVPNIRPEVHLTAGAATSDSTGVDYRVRFEWFGTDEDGTVVVFQYAIDDTSTSEAWTDTTQTRVRLMLPATHAGGFQTDDTLSDWHTFYVRAIDNESAVSLPDKRHFNTRTIAPETRIVHPPSNLLYGTLEVGSTLPVDWTGEDLDSTLPDRRPASFEYKLIHMHSPYLDDSVAVAWIITKENLLLEPDDLGDRTRWIRVPGDQTGVILRDLPNTGPEILVFSVRAVDEAGAVEPTLDRGENWFRMHVTDRPWRLPELRVYVHPFGHHDFPSDGDTWEIDVPSGVPVRFCWHTPPYTRVDYILDPHDRLSGSKGDPHGSGRWIGWDERDCIPGTLIFPAEDDGQVHVLRIRISGPPSWPPNERTYQILMKVVATRFLRTALLVDDARIGYGLSSEAQDQVHDNFVMRFIGRILEFASDGLDVCEMYRRLNCDPEGLRPTDAQALSLEEMLQYSAILWSHNHTHGETTGLWFHEHESPPVDRALLSSYVAAGGKLFLFGGRPVAALTATSDRTYPSFEYPLVPPQGGAADQHFSQRSFIWQFLHVRSQVVGVGPFDCEGSDVDDHQSWRDGLVQCVSRNPAYPDLHLDPLKHDSEVQTDCPLENIPPVGGIRDYEGILHDSQYGPILREAGLDTLYTSVCYDWHGSRSSRWHGAVIAQRYTSTAADTLLGQVQGRVVLFLFQPYPFYEATAIDAGTAAINWLMTGSDY